MTPEEIAKEYPNLRLGDLFRLSVFIADNAAQPVPMSMRSFMKGKGSHQKMMRIVDAAEKSAEQLLIYRVVVNEDGTHSDRIVKSYSEAVALEQAKANGVPGAKGTKRLAGALTPYARIWFLYGQLVGELFHKVTDTDSPAAVEQQMEDAIVALRLANLPPGFTPVNSDLKRSHGQR